MYADLWAAGFSSDEEDGLGQTECCGSLELLASLVEERGGVGEKNDTITAPKSAETFEESLAKPDEVSLMKGTCIWEH